MILKLFLLIPFSIAFVKLIIYPLRRSSNTFRCSQTVNAVIVDIKRMELYDDEEGGTYIRYRPVYKYEFGGNIFYKTSHYKHGRNSQIGKTVKIRINPQNPEEIYDQSIFFRLFRNDSFCCVGITFCKCRILCICFKVVVHIIRNFSAMTFVPRRLRIWESALENSILTFKY